ncbi:MAG: diadenylate cyclase [Spirosomaceae bacterium]|jgi:diadenylate cyclase|nr:diadenylate cyclase [Spirosomataceae bacterium]
MFLFQIGFLTVEWVDILDVALVAFLLYQIYFLVRGSLASRVFLGYLLIYLFYLIVKAIGLELLTKILEYFMGVGAVALLVIFQQEIRRFLLFVGKSTAFANNRLLGRFFNTQSANNNVGELKSVIETVRTMASEFTGGLLVIKKNDELDKYILTGEEIDALPSKRLLLSLFNQYSPMNDGGAILANGRIKAARCILPVSDSDDYGNIGFRHRAALGMSEVTDAAVLVVSEETGRISLALEGKLLSNIAASEAEERLKKYFTQS